MRRAAIAQPLWDRVTADLFILKGLTDAERQRLRRLTTRFLYHKKFDPVQDLELGPERRLFIAVQACLPILNLGLRWYRGWTTMIVYPGDFVPRREEVDEAGVVHLHADPLSGEAWRRGPVVLSWSGVAVSGRRDGYNVIIHELAHKLDMRNGDANGHPPLPRHIPTREWRSAFVAAFDDMNQRLDAGEEPAIDPYAANSPAECFAVFSEYFFEQPQLLFAEYPRVYGQLAAFYRQAPLQRLA